MKLALTKEEEDFLQELEKGFLDTGKAKKLIRSGLEWRDGKNYCVYA